MPIIPRKDNSLNEAIDYLDQHLDVHKGNTSMAFNSLDRSMHLFIEEEIRHCVIDERYYFENYHAIKTEGHGVKTLYPFYDAQEMYYERILANRIRATHDQNHQIRLMILKARQMGLSTVTEAYISWRTFFTEACNSIIVAQDPDQADYLFGMSRLAYDTLPWWMRPQERYQAKGRYLVLDKKDPRERQRAPGLQSAIYVEAANSMSGVAVGKTMRNAHLSELSAWRGGGQILATELFPTMNAWDLFVVLESTARGKDGFWYRMWCEAVAGKIDWEPIFIPFFRVKKYSLPLAKGEVFVRTEEEKAIAKKVREDDSFEMTDEIFKWRRKKAAESAALNHGDESMLYQEYPMNWHEAFQASGICAFDKKKLMTMQKVQAMKPVYWGECSLDAKTTPPTPKFKLRRIRDFPEPPAQEKAGGRLHIWETPDRGDEYYIGADVAQGIEGRDYSCAAVYRIGRGNRKDEQVAEWHGWINPTAFARVLAALGWYYNTAQIACEINDCGRDVNSELFRAIEYPNIYQWKQIDKIKNAVTNFMGWQTTHRTRPSLIRTMRESVDDNYVVIRSIDTIDQLLSFGALEDGDRIEGLSGNDDRVFAHMICLYCAHEMDFGMRTGGAEEEKPRADVDFNNTDYSPIYDKDGPRRDMVKRGSSPSSFGLSDLKYPDPVSADDIWKTW